MGCYDYVSRLQDQVEGHSTVIGRVWMNSLFVFRVLVLGAAASLVWWDEHALFVCNTQQPGCANTCYDAAFPISLIRFWVVQVLCVSFPTLVHVVYAVYAAHQDDKPERTKRNPPQVDKDSIEMVESGNKADRAEAAPVSSRRAPSFQHYLTRMCFKIILEMAFIVCQYVFVGFVMDPEIKCPCPSSGECIVPRSTEKTIFSIFMAALACVSLLLNVAEMTYSLCSRRQRRRQETISTPAPAAPAPAPEAEPATAPPTSSTAPES